MALAWLFKTQHCLPVALVMILAVSQLANAHIAPFVKGMYCENSTDTGVPFNPLTNHTFQDWWMHSYDGCDKQLPVDGVFLELPAGGTFDVEMAEHKICTTMGSLPLDSLGNFGNCESYDLLTYGNFANGSCITHPNLHARNRDDAAGSAFAISYTSNISLVTPENLVVFSVAPNTPFEKKATFSVPAAMPICPPGGCICAWGWVPNGCGTLNMYMLPYRCQVTGATSTTPVSAPQPPVYCHDTPSKCTQGAKQMIFVYQQDGNNVNVPPGAVEQLAPGYSMKNGFAPGAQDDIFVTTIATGGTNYDEPSVHQTELATVSPIEQNEDRPRRPLRFARDLVIFPDHEHDPSPTPTSSAVVSESPTSTLSSTSSETGIPMYPVATPPPPSSKSDKIVVAHVVVGNTYPYTKDDWIRDIILASSKGIDAFVLNYGADQWEEARIADAYEAALAVGDRFKLFLSPDVTSLPCGNPEDASRIKNLIQMYARHTAQLIFRGRALVSSFGGEYCTFGTSSVSDGWASVVRNGAYPVYFVPAFFVEADHIKDYPVLDGLFGWDGSWPRADRQTNWDYDQARVSANGQDKIYMAAASPWFFAHYPSKNWFYGGDEWLYNTRWEQLVSHRDQIDIVQIISWNDYGESHYVGPIEGAQPGSNAWVDGYDHTPWLDMAAPYVSTFKTGAWKAFERDELYMWSRPHPHDASASEDGVGKPLGWDWTSDYLWATVYTTGPASVSLSSGDDNVVFSIYPGITKLRVPSRPGPIRGTLSREGNLRIDLEHDSFSYSASPRSYNFNAFVESGTA